MYELVIKMSAVQRRLIKKTETLIAKEVEMRDIERINSELKKQLIRLPGHDIGERLNQSRDVIKAKSRQIKASILIVSLHTYNGQSCVIFLLCHVANLAMITYCGKIA